MAGAVLRAGTDSDFTGSVLPSLAYADMFSLSPGGSLVIKTLQRVNQGTIAGTAGIAGIGVFFQFADAASRVRVRLIVHRLVQHGDFRLGRVRAPDV